MKSNKHIQLYIYIYIYITYIQLYIYIYTHIFGHEITWNHWQVLPVSLLHHIRENWIQIWGHRWMIAPIVTINQHRITAQMPKISHICSSTSQIWRTWLERPATSYHLVLKKRCFTSWRWCKHIEQQEFTAKTYSNKNKESQVRNSWNMEKTL